ncbi:TauD/TfdA family dioxygenase [Nocardia sp. CDC159]|uniref:TauD/TfdA family dioxygenase n=1 Tax=Nocardia pulmonis TaxID=2951408 RepID=A0A9X2EFB9_9NOCA|nr:MULTISPECIES: TauD/TfdA family dioxygenase [Nocardia]MCM6778425.1 TauD/TfdA family dioxygenase [Nocardia pulmonis]MCM6791314.1 TauD/TfdA family dioxygenase [Nocardia sp. CDC159]
MMPTNVIRHRGVPATFDCGPRVENWIAGHMEEIRETFAATGVVLLRGLGTVADRFDTVVAHITGEQPQPYAGGATPRTRLHENVYTSTDFPPQYAIDLHSEMAYATTWPRYLGFCCTRAASRDGATPIAPTDVVAERIPARLRAALDEVGVRYRRCFHPLLGEDWTVAFGTDDLEALEVAVRQRGEQLEVGSDGAVTTTIVLPAYLEIDGAAHWFNQVVAFNIRTLPDDLRADLLEVAGEERVPKNSTFGDGRPFSDEDIAAVRDAVASASIRFSWKPGDLLVIDNRRFAHGREPFAGAREIRVCMTGAGTWAPPYARRIVGTGVNGDA